MHELSTKYTWAEHEDIVLTVAAISGKTEAQVVEIYGGNPDESQDLTFAEAEDLGPDTQDGPAYFEVFPVGSHVVALENNGWSGTIPEIARRTSRPTGSFVSVSWNVNGVFRIVQAQDGKITAWFDPLYGSEQVGPADVIPDWAHGVDFAIGQLRSICLAVWEEQGGVSFEHAWLTGKLPTYRIPDPDVMLKNVENARLP